MSSEPKKKTLKLMFVKSFRHWRSRKIIHAKDYGLKGFPIWVGVKK